MKRCPRCDRLLVESSFGALRVDGCHGCGGVWFDDQELTAAARSKTGALDDLEDRFRASPVTKEHTTEMSCPICKVELLEFEFKHSPGIKLDGCRQCKGIWVDDGELDQLHERLSPAPSPAAARQQPKKPTSASAKRDTRERVRQAAGILASLECPGCGESVAKSVVGRPSCSLSFSLRSSLREHDTYLYNSYNPKSTYKGMGLGEAHAFHGVGATAAEVRS